ncbi:hypothetical protein OG914_06765 [Streptomyces sp. NBC_00291]|uniref:hypothetical protein n=1 Tax=Streptomyces sp. NBC_00291 TaxID=2975704 RepID=UPI002251B3C6|nr:hypothetical protein [Streptomyces sp. NBC_00291]MCX5153712.1 hypothetical protein [Streptomyces sp. NBC_00291]
MGLQIFATDPDAKPKPKPELDFSTDFTFQFRSGMVVNKKPISLPAWRVVTGDPLVADAVAQLLGGTVEEYDSTKEANLHILTEAESVEVVIDGSKAVDDKLILWGRTGPIHECDGVAFLSPPERKGDPCGCPKLMTERKEMARQGIGPAPAINVTFRLAHDYELGKGRLIASAWTLAEVIHEVKDALDDVDGEALCRLTLEHVSYVNSTGVKVDFRKPVIEVIGSYNDAVAEPR